MTPVTCHVCGATETEPDDYGTNTMTWADWRGRRIYSCQSHTYNEDRRALGLPTFDEEGFDSANDPHFDTYDPESPPPDPEPEPAAEALACVVCGATPPASPHAVIVTSSKEWLPTCGAHTTNEALVAAGYATTERSLTKRLDPTNPVLGEAMTSKTPQELYELAAERNVIIHALQTSGRKWSGTLQDASYPQRAGTSVWMAADDFKSRIERYANGERETWVKARALNDAIILAPPAAPIAVAGPTIIEIPADDTPAYDAGFNAGLTTGMRLGGEQGDRTGYQVGYENGYTEGAKTLAVTIDDLEKAAIELSETRAALDALKGEYRDRVAKLETTIGVMKAATWNIDDELDTLHSAIESARNHRRNIISADPSDDENEHDSQINQAATDAEHIIEGAIFSARAERTLASQGTQP